MTEFTYVLAIDTATPTQSVALLAGDVVLAEHAQVNRRGHAGSLVSSIDAVLKDSEKSLSDLDLIAVGIGPGSFTGVRVGLAAAKSLSFVHDIPVVAVSSLLCAAKPLVPFKGLIAPIFDARKQEVYGAIFRANDRTLTRLAEDQTFSSDKLAAALHEARDGEEAIALNGQGLKVYQSTLEGCLPTGTLFASSERWAPSVSALGFEGRKLAIKGQIADIDVLEPNYQRASEAEINWAKKS